MSGYEQDLIIDKYALDTECMDQSRRFAKWSEAYADAIAERDRAEQRLEVTKARIEMEMRKAPQQFGLEKVTDAAIKSAVTLNQDVMTDYEAWIQAKHTVGVLMSARDAFEQRRAMLENLVKLYLQGYWADPKIPSDAKNTFTEESANKQREALSKSPSLQKRKIK